MPGEKGADGKSAYTAAAENGYTGTEQEFNTTLGNLGNLNTTLDAINGEVIAKVDQLERDLEAMKAAQEERDAISCRSRILHFGDETIHGVRHTKEHFEQILRDITSYEQYCEEHPHFENNTTVLTSQRIKDIYEECLKTADFL